jgi:L-ribulokinase
MYTIGIDYGTESGRALLVRVADGAEIATAVHAYGDGVIDERLPGSDRRCRPTGRCRTPTTTSRS